MRTRGSHHPAELPVPHPRLRGACLPHQQARKLRALWRRGDNPKRVHWHQASTLPGALEGWVAMAAERCSSGATSLGPALPACSPFSTVAGTILKEPPGPPLRKFPGNHGHDRGRDFPEKTCVYLVVTHTPGFLPRALHLEWGAHSLANDNLPTLL